MIKGNAVVAQSGGPTSVINASLAGVIAGALAAEGIGKIYGSRNGIEGIIKDNLVELKDVDLEVLKRTPGSYLGTCRYKLPKAADAPDVYVNIAEVFAKYDIKYFFYIGGNDSMDTANKIGKYVSEKADLTVVGVPKTIDNDLPFTDHTPGYGSAAKYIATSTAELYMDVKSFDFPYVLTIETMGRHAGWLAAATALAKDKYGAPDLIYLPEINFSLEKFLSDVEAKFKEKNVIVAVASEGIKYAPGEYVSAASAAVTDKFGHASLGGCANVLAAAAKEHFKCKTRSVVMDMLQRCAAHCASATDVNEAFMIGRSATEEAARGGSGVMMTFVRNEGPYGVSVGTCPLEQAANVEYTIPKEWINASENFVTQECLDYMRPLIQGELPPLTEDGLPKFAVL